MFKIDDNPTFAHTVTVHVPCDGGHERQTMRVTYRVIAVDEVAKFDLETPEGSRDFLLAVVKEVGDVADQSGEPLPFSEKLLRRLISLPHVRLAMARGYQAGIAGAKTKN